MVMTYPSLMLVASSSASQNLVVVLQEHDIKHQPGLSLHLLSLVYLCVSNGAGLKDNKFQPLAKSEQAATAATHCKGPAVNWLSEPYIYGLNSCASSLL